MEVNVSSELEARLNEASSRAGCAKDDLVRDALSSYLDELAEVGSLLDRRYDDLKSGRVQAIDGELAFARIRKEIEARRAGHG